jgi:hypothetical protein
VIASTQSNDLPFLFGYGAPLTHPEPLGRPIRIENESIVMTKEIPKNAQDNKLKEFGFQPGETVYPFRPDTNLPRELGTALVGSTYDEPTVVHIEVHEDLAFNVVVDMIRAVYEPYRFSTGDRPLGCWRRPNLYAEGWLMKSGFDPYPEIIHVRMYLDYLSAESGDGYVQRVPDSYDSDDEIVLFS